LSPKYSMKLLNFRDWDDRTAKYSNTFMIIGLFCRPFPPMGFRPKGTKSGREDASEMPGLPAMPGMVPLRRAVCWLSGEKAVSDEPEVPGREKRFDVLRNSADLYGAVHHIVSILAAYDLSGGVIGPFQSADLCRTARKVLPHLPAPSKDANTF
jgi:hypothetical protein